MAGQLKNNNPSGDLAAVKKCGAKNRSGFACRSPAMKNGRCRLHGGMSTGPRTSEGLSRSRRANYKHGKYCMEEIQKKKVDLESRLYVDQYLRKHFKGWSR